MPNECDDQAHTQRMLSCSSSDTCQHPLAVPCSLPAGVPACLCYAVDMQSVRGAVLDLVVELIATSSMFIGNCLQVCACVQHTLQHKSSSC